MERLKAGLYLLGLPLSGVEGLSIQAELALGQAELLLAESERTAQVLYKKHRIALPELILLNEHTNASEIIGLFSRIQGKIALLMSDSGMPVLCDPGADLVRFCHARTYPVHVLAGPTAATTALALAGLANNAYLFAGFLPRQSVLRKRALESHARLIHPVVFYETAYRLQAVLTDIYAVLATSGLSLFLACELGADCNYVDLPVADIKKRAAELPSGRPVIIIYRPGPAGNSTGTRPSRGKKRAK